mmetsp:Transcript_75905/g.111103  ORF Transcript_75905/g.111103 Transcript_75905/m.111103 type:complete len:223 (+) Transcript_75905:295-963(+)
MARFDSASSRRRVTVSPFDPSSCLRSSTQALPPCTASLIKVLMFSSLRGPSYTKGGAERLPMSRMRGSVSTRTEKFCRIDSCTWRTIPKEHSVVCSSASSCQSSGISSFLVMSTALSGRLVLSRKVSSVSGSSINAALALAPCMPLSIPTSFVSTKWSLLTASSFSWRSSTSASSRSLTVLSLARACCRSISSFLRTASTCPTCESFMRADSARAAFVVSRS